MLPTNVRIFFCTAPQDMRRGFDRLALAAHQATGFDPRDGDALFCFVNKRRNRLKVLWWDGTGSCVLYKRLGGAIFKLEHTEDDGGPSVVIDAHKFGELLRGVRSRRRRARRRIRKA